MRIRQEQLSDDVTCYLGDCRDILAAYAAKIKKANVLITDPPYGVELILKSQPKTKVKNKQSSITYQDTPKHVKRLITTVLVPTIRTIGRAAIFPGTRMMFNYPQPEEVGGVFTQGSGVSRWGFACFHPILYYGKDPYLANRLGSFPNSVERTAPTQRGIDHPCPKPLSWMKWLVNRASLQDECILDTFMGSGTTGVACVHLTRKFIGIEIELKYFDIACKRIDEALQRPDCFRPVNRKSKVTRII